MFGEGSNIKKNWVWESLLLLKAEISAGYSLLCVSTGHGISF
jgi:hypothetical protein